MAKSQTPYAKSSIGLMTAKRDGQVLALWQLRSTWLNDREWQPGWTQILDAVRRITADWPDRLAAAAASHGDDRRLIHDARDALRPLLQGVADLEEMDLRSAAEALTTVWDGLQPPPAVRAVATTAEAKRALMTAAAATARFRADVRRGHGWRRRAEVRWCLLDAITRSRIRWWSGWPYALHRAWTAGTDLRAAAEQVRREALDELEISNFRWPRGRGAVPP
jgi:hypothetical protein